MKKLDQWMTEYSASHQQPVNKIIHKICVPLIMLSVIGLLWSLPYPTAFQHFPYLNWATLFIASCLFFYFSLSFVMFLGMLIQSLIMCWVCMLLEQENILLITSLFIFIISWIAQFYGHKIEGKKPSFLQDLIFLLIGPLWVLRSFLTKLGLR